MTVLKTSLLLGCTNHKYKWVHSYMNIMFGSTADDVQYLEGYFHDTESRNHVTMPLQLNLFSKMSVFKISALMCIPCCDAV